MTVTFQVEKWSAALAELRPFFHLLWDDVAVDKDRFVAKCDETKYAALEKMDMLHLVTARSEGKLAGYYVAIVAHNPHYLGAGLMALTDMYFILPEFRCGNLGLKLFAFAEDAWRAKGCVKAYSSHKIHRDRSAMFRALGWKPSDIIYSKVLA